MNYRYDTPQAAKVVQDIRTAVHAVPGADAMVGGQAAIQLRHAEGVASTTAT